MADWSGRSDTEFTRAETDSCDSQVSVARSTPGDMHWPCPTGRAGEKVPQQAVRMSFVAVVIGW